METNPIDPPQMSDGEYIQWLEAERTWLQAIVEEHDDLQDSFDLRYKADMRAIKMWQAATGRELTWPDHADLVVWLLNRLDAAEAEGGE